MSQDNQKRTKKCPHCQMDISSLANKCPRCQSDLEVSKSFRSFRLFSGHPTKHRIGKAIGIGFLIFIFLTIIAALLSKDQGTSVQPTVAPQVTTVLPTPTPVPTKEATRSPVPTYRTPTQTSESNSYNIIASVVNVFCASKDKKELSSGSGVIIGSDGLILTNSHIVPQIGEVPNIDLDRCGVALPDPNTGQPKELYWAQPVIFPTLSKKYDIAALKVTAVYVNDERSWGTFPNTFPFFQSSPVCKGRVIKLGDAIKIYGYPVTSGEYNLIVTEGIVSGFNKDGTYLTSAKIDSGNSGGLAVDKDGCFAGIPSAIKLGDYQNLGVVIPPSLLKKFTDEMLKAY